MKALLKKIYKKIIRAPLFFVKQIKSLQEKLVIFFVSALTENYWLIDYLPSKRKNEVLIVRLDLIGDFVIWLDSARAYRELFPDQKIVLFANSAWAELATQFDYWDEVIFVNASRLRANDSYRLKQLLKMRRRGFSVAIQPTYSREYVADLVIRATGAVKRIAPQGNLSNIALEKKVLSDKWYTHLVDLHDQPEIELNLNANFVRALGAASFISALPVIDQKFKLENDFQINEPYFVVMPGASWAPKMWPAANFAELAKSIHNTHGFKLVLCGTSAESQICKEVEALSGLQAINLAGRTKICDMVEIIRGAELLVANDSAGVHIAVATKTYSICILGGGHFGRFLPYPKSSGSNQYHPKLIVKQMDCYGCNWNCKYLLDNSGVVPCIANAVFDDQLIGFSTT